MCRLLLPANGITKIIFKDFIAKVQTSAKLGARRFGPFEVIKTVGKNAVQLKLPDGARIHPVLHIEHTRPHRSQPEDIAAARPPKPRAVKWKNHELQYVVEEIMSHRRRGRKYQFLILMKNAPRHDAAWQPVSDFVDEDAIFVGTITEVLLNYFRKHNILRNFH